MSCVCVCDVTYCDAIEAIRALWGADPLLQAEIPVAADETNRVYEDGNVYEPTMPYAVLRDLGETARSSLGSNQQINRAIRIRFYTESKEQAVTVARLVNTLLARCFSEGVCIEGGWLLWGRVLTQGGGFISQGKYQKQLLVQLFTSQEGTL
jgi:hypothetical protein